MRRMGVKENIQYYVEVGVNGIGYSTRCDDLKDAKNLFKQRKMYEDNVKLVKYNGTRNTKTILNQYNRYGNN